ncbi:MAG: hypothetical protein D6820_14725, partial [Lentisphaerae bacterium]
SWDGGPCQIQIHWGDARFIARLLQQQQACFDIICLDPFSTQRCSELWTADFLAILRDLLEPARGVLLTYSTAGPVRAGMLAAELYPGELSPPGSSIRGTIAVRHPANVRHPLSPEDLRRLQDSSKGIPFSDPTLLGSNSEILRRREEMVRSWRRSHASQSST